MVKGQQCMHLRHLPIPAEAFSLAVFALDFFFHGHVVTYRDIPEGVSTVRPHLDLSSAAE